MKNPLTSELNTNPPERATPITPKHHFLIYQIGTVVFLSQDDKSSMDYKSKPSEGRMVIGPEYIDGDITLKVSFVLRQLEMKNINKTEFNEKAIHDYFTDHFWIPIISYKLKKEINNEDRFITPIWKTEYSFNISYLDGKNTQQVKKFFLPDEILKTVKGLDRSESEIKAFLDGSKNPENPLDIYKEIKDYINKYVDLKPWATVGMAIWVMGTHVFEIFSAYPYLYLLASRGSGKTRVLDTLFPICCRSKFFINATESSLFRTINSYKPTLLLDESESLSGNDPNSKINALLNQSYKKGSMIPRTDQDNNYIVREFEIYCPKSLATTKPIPPILVTRCLSLSIDRTINHEKYANAEPSKNDGRRINNRVALWALENGSAIYDANKESNLPGVYDGLLKSATPRIKQILKPILLIASSIGVHDIPGELEILKQFINHQNESARTETLDDDHQKVIVAIYNIVKREAKPGSESVEIFPVDILSEMGVVNLPDVERREWTHKRIGKIVATHDQIERGRKSGGVKYTVTMKGIIDICNRYNIQTGFVEESEPITDLEKRSWIKSHIRNGTLEDNRYRYSWAVPLMEKLSVVGEIYHSQNTWGITEDMGGVVQ